MLKRYFLSAVIMAAFLAVFGCTDRGTNVPDYYQTGPWGVWPRGDHVFDTLLALQMTNESKQLPTAILIPNEALSQNGGSPIPTLVLLAPEDADKFYYFNHGLLALYKAMVHSGEIQPMVICCVGNDRVFGGYWYANSAPAGFYDGIIGAPGDSGLVQWIHASIPATIDLPSKRGIGGIATGSYGAFRAMLKHPGTYSSISVTDGPLDFDGLAGNTGLMPLFKTAMEEQLTYGHLGRGIRDSSGVIVRDTFIRFDSLKMSPISRILLGGAYAFSPKDTGVSFSYFAINPNRDTVLLYTRRSITDTASLVKRVIAPPRAYHRFDAAMPFYINSDPALLPSGKELGDVYDPIWGLWLQNNLDALYANAGPDPLAGVNMFFATSQGSAFNYFPMTQSWITFLEGKGLTSQISEYRYQSDAGIDTYNRYTYDILRKMLKFHSDNFGR
ncbi:MAG: hypothetical protein HY851_09790 [candidate division Zixibacteria bacterium]|nr:hypothetical protein [candidate division Zixibacteria bacterium]